MSKRKNAFPPKALPTTDGDLHLEDKAMKVAAQYFGSELLPLIGVKGRVSHVAPTEQVHLEARQFTEDFNYVMEDGTWTHLEFESDSITTKDLRRFRVYESYISYTYGVKVTTYVICTSHVKRIKSELQEGINTYRVQVIRMKNRDGDTVIRQMEAKQKAGQKLDRAELTELILTPLMGGDSSPKEKIRRSMVILRSESSQMVAEDAMQMQSVLYAFAEKFLNRQELDEIKEVMTMTRLGQMIMEDGIQKGRVEGRVEGWVEGRVEGRVEGTLSGERRKLISLVRKKLAKGLSNAEIADILEEDVSRIAEMVAAIRMNPEVDDDTICKLL